MRGLGGEEEMEKNWEGRRSGTGHSDRRVARAHTWFGTLNGKMGKDGKSEQANERASERGGRQNARTPRAHSPLGVLLRGIPWILTADRERRGRQARHDLRVPTSHPPFGI